MYLDEFIAYLKEAEQESQESHSYYTLSFEDITEDSPFYGLFFKAKTVEGFILRLDEFSRQENATFPFGTDLKRSFIEGLYEVIDFSDMNQSQVKIYLNALIDDVFLKFSRIKVCD